MAKGKKFRLKPQVPNEFLTVAETAELLRVEPHSVYRYLKQNGLPYSRVGRRYLIDREALRRWISENGTGDFTPYENS